jgi:hypothetical protein
MASQSADFVGPIFHGPVPEAVVAEAERALGIEFPPSYRAFLLAFGASFGGDGPEIAGLTSNEFEMVDEQPQWSSVLRGSLQSRRWGVDPALLAISQDGEDTTMYLDTRKVTADGECFVVAIGPGSDEVVVSRSFEQFRQTPL